jgi:hypothetical protein
MSTDELPLFEIRESDISGKGAFALQFIAPKVRLIEYTGERVSHEVADARYAAEEAAGNYHTVLFSVDDNTVIDAGVNGNDARFFNHSCDGNCQSRIVRGRVYLETIRPIEPGEELTYDYEIPREGETDETAREKYPCFCGAANCRGTLLLPATKSKPKRRVAAAKKGPNARSRLKRQSRGRSRQTSAR